MRNTVLIAILSLLALTSSAQTRPTTNQSAARVIAELKAENERLKRELAELKKLLAMLPLPARGSDIEQEMPKVAAEATLKAKGWVLQRERQPTQTNHKLRQTWQKTEGEFLHTRYVDYDLNVKNNWEVVWWEDEKVRR